MRKNNKLLLAFVATLVLAGGYFSVNFFTQDSNNNNLNPVMVEEKQTTLQIRLDTGNLDEKNIQEAELHSLNDQFLSFLETIDGIDIVTPAFSEYIGVSKDIENYNPMEKQTVYDVKENGVNKGTQEVESFKPTNYLEIFNESRFKKYNTLVAGSYPQDDSQDYEVLITDTYSSKEDVTVGDKILVTSFTLNGIVKKEAIISGIYHVEELPQELVEDLPLDTFYANFENTKQMTFFSDIVYDNFEIEVHNEADVDKIISEIKEKSGVRPEILIIDRI